MQFWIDADSCPKAIKEVVYRAAQRKQVVAVFVANCWLATPASPFIRKVQVSQGLDVADAYIVQQLKAKDLVITADIPLAAQVIEKGATALNPRGEWYNQENIGHLLALRNLHSNLRDAGLISGGPGKLGPKEIQAFANRLDAWLAHNTGFG